MAIRNNIKKQVDTGVNNNRDAKSWWATVKKLTSSKPRQNEFFNIDNTWLNSSDFSEGCNKYFSSVASDVQIGTIELDEADIVPTEISIGEIKRMLRRMKTNKASHCSDYPSWITKEAAEDLCVPVHDIISCMLRNSTYPTLWKAYSLKPIPKTANPSAFNNYRPIALAYHLSKIAEEVIICQLRPKVDIAGNQFAYTAGNNTTGALLKMCHEWTNALDKPGTNYVDAAFIDMSKAFDRMNPATLISKLVQREIPSSIVKLISTYLSKREHIVAVGNARSDVESISVGVPQGSKLGPLLWTIYIDDLTPACQITKYADDCSLYAANGKNCQVDTMATSIQQTEEWCQDNSMLLNTSKSIVMKISLSPSIDQTSNLSINNEILDMVEETKVLGIVIDNKLKFNSHVSSVISKANSRIYILRVLASSGVDSDNLLRFFKSCILSVLTYCFEAWYNFITELDRKRLERVQNLALKYILVGNFDSYEDRLNAAGISSIQDLYLSRSKTLFCRILTRDSGALSDIVNGFKNKGRKSTRSHTSSMFSFRAKTDKYQRSFFISNFLKF